MWNFIRYPLITIIITATITLVAQSGYRFTHIPDDRSDKNVLITRSLVKNNSESNQDTTPDNVKKGVLCVPQYSTGCSMGDGFTDFAVAEIENYSSGCQNLNGNGWSQYPDLGPAIFFPGSSYDFIMQTGYDDQYVTIWIDYDDDLILTDDEKILSNFVMTSAGTFYAVSATIPSNALPGQHIMRARTNWAASCNDPCQSYTYGEAEDYYVFIGVPAFGTLTGTVTHLSDGSPVPDANILLTGSFNYSTITGSDGSYSISNIMQGDYSATCSKSGYNLLSASVTIVENNTTVQHFQLTQPTIVVAPLSIFKTTAPGSIAEEIVTIQNNGNGLLDWSASIQISSKNTDEFMDLQFQYPVGVGGGEAGIETDGNYFYTSKWNGANFYQYDLDGSYIGTFIISGVSSIRDMAYDGTFFYGGTGFSTVYEMDFNNQTLVSSFTAPTDCRAIAYNEDLEIFYANNWSTPIIKFDKSGNNLGSFNVGPEGGEYYGFAYDHATTGGPFLWGYAQLGSQKNKIIQIQLPSGTETGFTMDVTTKLSGQIYNFAGGLFSHHNLIFGKWTLGGLVQSEWIWGLELTDAQTWLSVIPNTGSLTGGTSQEVTIQFDATDLEPGIYNAEIQFTSTPDVGAPIVQVELTVEVETNNYELSDKKLTIQVFPNPAKEKLYIQSSFPLIITQLYTISGDIILTETQPEKMKELNISGLNRGIYLLKIITSQKTVFHKIIAE